MNTVSDVQDFDVQNKKEVVIVCKKGLEELAECFRMFISKESDIKAIIMRQNEYQNNRMEFSSENYVIFLGNHPERKDFMKQLNLNDESAEYGIFIGEYGKVALIQVHLDYFKILSNKNKYQNYVRSTEKSLRNTAIIAVLMPLLGGILAPIGWYTLFDWKKRKIIKQLYTCAITEYYKKYLKSFLGIDNNE